jgi:hypothetical protein
LVGNSNLPDGDGLHRRRNILQGLPPFGWLPIKSIGTSFALGK